MTCLVWWEWRKRSQRVWRKRMAKKERKTSHLAFRRTTDRSIEWSSWSSSREQLLCVCVWVCVYQWHMADGNPISQISQISHSFCGSQMCFEVLWAKQKIQIATRKRIMQKRRHEGFLSLQKLLNWNKRHKQRWTNGSKQKNRDIWDSKKRKNAKTRKQRKQLEKSTNWSRAPTAQPSFSGPACSLSFPAIGNKTKITPRIDTKASVYQFHLDWPIPRRQNASKAAQMKPVQRSGNPPKVFRLL